MVHLVVVVVVVVSFCKGRLIHVDGTDRVELFDGVVAHCLVEVGLGAVAVYVYGRLHVFQRVLVVPTQVLERTPDNTREPRDSLQTLPCHPPLNYSLWRQQSHLKLDEYSKQGFDRAHFVFVNR